MEAWTLWSVISGGVGAVDALLVWSLAFVAGAGLCAVFGFAACFARDPVARRMRGLVPPSRARAGAAPGSVVLRRRTAPARRRGLPRLGLQKAPRLVFATVGGGIFLGLWQIAALPPGAAIAAAAACVYLGLILPQRWLARRRTARRDAIVRGLPDALDMVVICVEAGLGLDAALTRVGVEVAPAQPELAEELGSISLALRAGQSRAEALQAFARRCAAPEASALATLLVQAGQLGTGVADGLRLLAEEMREARLLEAEEIAHALPVKLTIPLVVCILPALITVVLLPGIVTIVRDILPSLGR